MGYTNKINNWDVDQEIVVKSLDEKNNIEGLHYLPSKPTVVQKMKIAWYAFNPKFQIIFIRSYTILETNKLWHLTKRKNFLCFHWSVTLHAAAV